MSAPIPSNAALKFMQRSGGSFAIALAQAATFADPENLQILADAFPLIFAEYAKRAAKKDAS